MKKVFIAFIATLMVMAFSHNTAQAQISISAPLLTGCVGNCGPSFYGSITAPTSRTYTFRSTSSLCPSHTAFAIIQVDGNTVYSGPIGNNTNISFDAKAGHSISVYSRIYHTDPTINCVWLGETKFGIY